MTCSLKTLLPTVLLTLGAGIGHGFADEREVNNIWWEVEQGYNGSHETACVAENYNDNTVDAVFDLFPASYDFNGNPMPATAVVRMRPYTTYKVFGWPEERGSDPHCALRSYSAHVQ
ncbi:MAG TPA: hypothetical protein VKS78_04200 [Roseiarcus sp.]|nr:hypothetical protein [Roseiarcus sp.]